MMMVGRCYRLLLLASMLLLADGDAVVDHDGLPFLQDGSDEFSDCSTGITPEIRLNRRERGMLSA